MKRLVPSVALVVVGLGATLTYSSSAASPHGPLPVDSEAPPPAVAALLDDDSFFAAPDGTSLVDAQESLDATGQVADPGQAAAPGGGAPGPDVPPAAAIPGARPDDQTLDLAKSDLAKDSKYPTHSHPEIDTLHHRLDLSYDGRSITGRDAVTFRATTATQQVTLDLGATLKVTQAYLDGRPIRSQAGSDNTVTFQTGALTADSRHVLAVAYSGTPKALPAPATRGDMRNGVGWVSSGGGIINLAEPYGAMTFYPCNDWAGDKAEYDVRISTPASVMGITGGELTGRTRDAQHTVTTWHQDRPLVPYQFALAIDNYAYTAVPIDGGTTFHMWTLANTSSTAVADYTQDAQTSMKWLTSKFGQFPYATVGAVETRVDMAMETASMVEITTSMLGMRGTGVLQHELVHQWFADSLSPKDWRDLWLNEGWATFAQDKFMADTRGGRMQNYSSGCAQYTSSAGPAGDYDPGHFADSNVYLCGAGLLQELYQAKGDAEFWKMSRDWIAAHPYSNASRADFEHFLQQRYHSDYTSLTRKWLDNGGRG